MIWTRPRSSPWSSIIDDIFSQNITLDLTFLVIAFFSLCFFHPDCSPKHHNIILIINSSPFVKHAYVHMISTLYVFFLKQFIWTSQVISPLDFPRFWIFLIAYSWYSSSCIYVLYIPHKLASESRGLIRVSFNLSIRTICAFISRHRMSGFAFYFILLYFSCCLCSMHRHLIIGSKW